MKSAEDTKSREQWMSAVDGWSKGYKALFSNARLIPQMPLERRSEYDET